MVPWTKEIPKELKIHYCTFQLKTPWPKKCELQKEVLGGFFRFREKVNSSILFKYSIKLLLKYGC